MPIEWMLIAMLIAFILGLSTGISVNRPRMF
jgi:hypothetical protein